MVYDIRDRLVMTQDSLLRSQQEWLYTKYDTENRPDSTGLITDPTYYNQLSYQESTAFASNNYPVVSSYTTKELLTQNFYDDYSWVSAYGAPVASTMATTYIGNSNYFITTSSCITCLCSQSYSTLCHERNGYRNKDRNSWLREGVEYLYTASFYDDRGRVIQSQSSNYTGKLTTYVKLYNLIFRASLYEI